MPITTIKDFLRHGYTRWVEIHWTRAGTEEQARALFAQRGLTGTFYRVQFGYWMPV